MIALDVSIVLRRETDPVNVSPKAEPKLNESRTIWGLIYIKVGAALTALAEIIGGVATDVPDVISQAETHQSLAERGAALLSINVPWIGAACISAGLCLAFYARINAHMTGKVG